jgi:hypothetical protein
MANVHKIYPHLPLQDTPKFTLNLDFWFENILPSGNPGATTCRKKAGNGLNDPFRKREKIGVPQWLSGRM